MAVSPTAAQTSPGDVSKIGGQGLTEADCHAEGVGDTAFPGDDGTAGLGSARFNFNSFANIHSIAVVARPPNVLVPDRSVVRGLSGPVAGVAPGDPVPSSTSSTLRGTPRGLTGAAAEGADPRAVALRPVAVAVDPTANNLYILEANALRHVNLAGTPAIHTLVGPAVGTTLTAGDQSSLVADQAGRVFIGDSNSGKLYRLDPGSNSLVLVTTLASGSIAVDAGGTAVYGITGSQKLGLSVSRVDPMSGSLSVVAGGGTSTAEGVAATSASLGLSPVVAVDPRGGHLYIADGYGRIRMVDFKTGVINTVVGSGQRGYQADGKAASFSMNRVTALAVDLFGNVYMLVPDDCALFMAVTPAVIFTPPPPSNPPAPQPPPSTPAGPTGQDSPNTGSHPAPETAGTPNPAGAPHQGATPANQTQIVSSDNGSGAVQPQTELRILDPGNALTAPQQAGQVTVQPVPAPGSATQLTPTFSPAPTPATDAGTVTLADPGTSTAGAAANTTPVVPPAPAPAPVPPASAPPPAAPQPVSSPGLVHGDAAQPVRGATRYAMVRHDDEQPIAALAMAGAGAGVTVFLCVMFVAPGASSKPKPRPKGAY